MANHSWRVRRSSGTIGAEIYGVDLEALTDRQFNSLSDLFLEHLVLFFPDAGRLTSKGLVAFARRLGEPWIHPFLPKRGDFPELVTFDSQSFDFKTDSWHADGTFTQDPPVASILQITQSPRVGGDTIWSNQQLAYADLSAPLRDFLDGLTALHVLKPSHAPQPDRDATVRREGENLRQEAEHPVVWKHPVSGRPSLFVNRKFTRRILQLSKPESDLLLGYLFESSTQPRFCCRFRWQSGAVALWDNRATQHYAVADYSERRIGQRISLLAHSLAEYHRGAP